MPSASRVPRSAALLRALAVWAVAAVPLLSAAPASANADPLAGRSITGQLLQAYPESRADGVAEAPLSWVQPASGAPVRVDTADLAGVPAGATVRLTMGTTVDDGASRTVGTAHAVTDHVVLGTDGDTTAAPTLTPTAVPSATPTSSPTATTTPTAAPGNGGTAPLTDRVTVVLVEAGGGVPDRTTVQDLTAAVDGTVHDFWSEQTNGAVDLGVVSAHGWVATTAGCDTPTELWDQAGAAAGFTPGPGNHLLVYLSAGSADIADCSYGLSEIGSGLRSGGRLYVQDTLPSLIAHELGHNFGLGHSSGKQCDGAVDTGRCQVEGYRDYYDVMAASWDHVGTLNAAQEARLGVLPVAQQATFAATGRGGSVTLAALSGRSGVRALELTAADGTDYWLAYRSATGQDAWLATPGNRFGLQSGVLVHRSGQLPDTSLLLDGTPSPASGWSTDLQDALPVGAPVALADGFTVTVTSVAPGSASVTVGTTPPPPTTAATVAGPRVTTSQDCPTGACRATPPAGEPSAAARPVGTLLPYAMPAPAVPVMHRVAHARGLRPAALRSPAVLGAAGAVLGCAALLGWTLVRRLRRP